jgi:hypothetical protein
MGTGYGGFSGFLPGGGSNLPLAAMSFPNLKFEIMKVMKYDSLLSALRAAEIKGTLKQTNYGFLAIEVGRGTAKEFDKKMRKIIRICKTVGVHMDDYDIYEEFSCHGVEHSNNI